MEVAEKQHSEGSNVFTPMSNKVMANYYFSCPCLTLVKPDATNEHFCQPQ